MAWDILRSVQGLLSRKDSALFERFKAKAASEGKTSYGKLAELVALYVENSKNSDSTTPEAAKVANLPVQQERSIITAAQAAHSSDLMGEFTRLRETLRAARDLVEEMDGPAAAQEQPDLVASLVEAAAKSFMQGQLEIKQEREETIDRALSHKTKKAAAG